MTDPKSKLTAVTDPRAVPVVWASELLSIAVEGEVTILTFAETVTVDGPAPQRRVCARVAIATRLLPQIAGRMTQVRARSQALSAPAGNA